MELYRFYNTQENAKGKWKSCRESDLQQVVETEAFHVSMLACDKDIDTESFEDARYWGDVVIDIDASLTGEADPDTVIDLATESANQLIAYLRSVCSLDHIQIYCSGGRGYHIVIPASSIHSRKTPIKNLPKIYKKMVDLIRRQSGAQFIDQGMYAGKRGHMVRVPNKQRSNGKYKVQISVEELATMTADRYWDTCSEPRSAFPEPTTKPNNPQLAELFRKAREELKGADSGVEKINVKEWIEEELANFGAEDHPECIKRLSSGSRRTSANFHTASYQMAIYLSKPFVLDTERTLLMNTMAQCSESTTYNTIPSRFEHIQGQLKDAVKTPFMCSAVRSTVDMSDGGCSQCPIHRKVVDELANSTGVVEDEGYLLMNPDGAPRRITNFTLEIREAYMSAGMEGDPRKLWDSFMAEIVQNGRVIYTVILPLEFFDSKKTFTAAMDHVKTGRVAVTDADVRRLRDYLAFKAEDVHAMITTRAVGIQRSMYYPEDGDAPTPVLVWVEPSWSITHTWLTNIVRLEDKETGNIAKMEFRPVGSLTEEQDDVLQNLFISNTKEVVSKVLGWTMAAMLKELFSNRIPDFPLLNLTGSTGSGKTFTAALFSALAGADYRDGGPMTMGSSSIYPVKRMVSESTSVPRILDEASVAKAKYRWDEVREVLKACYQRSQLKQGMIKGKRNPLNNTNLGSDRVLATSPVIIISTSPPTEREMIDRCVEIRLLKNTQLNEACRDAYNSIVSYPERFEELFNISKKLIMQIVTASQDDVYAAYVWRLNQMSTRLDQRARKNYAHLLLGLDYLKVILTRLKASEETLKRLDDLTTYLEKSIEESVELIVKRRSKTELDTFFTTLLVLTKHTGDRGIIRHRHYCRKGQMLLIDLVFAHAQYKRYVEASGYCEFQEWEHVLNELKEEGVYIGMQVVGIPEAGDVNFHVLSVSKIESRGHDFSSVV